MLEVKLFSGPEDKLFWMLLKEARSMKHLFIPEERIFKPEARTRLEYYRWGWVDRGFYGGDYHRGLEDGYRREDAKV